MFKCVVLIFLFLNISSISARVISDKRGQIEIYIPSVWKYEKDLFGLPHVFITGDQNSKMTLSLTMTGIEGITLLPMDLIKNQNEYQAGRQRWASERGITIEKFYPYKLDENKAKQKIHHIGFEYKVSDKSYFEKSYYLECPKSLVHFKILGIRNEERFLTIEKSVLASKCL